MSLYLVTMGLGQRSQLLFCFVVGKLNQLLKIQETIDLLGSPHFDPPSGNQFCPFFNSFLWVRGFNPSRKLRLFVKKNMETAAANKKKPNTFVGKGLVTGIFNLQISCFSCKVQLFIRVISSKVSSSIL